MKTEAYLSIETGAMAYSIYEAALIAEGTPVIEGIFRPTNGVWSGIFETVDGLVYEITDGYIRGRL